MNRRDFMGTIVGGIAVAKMGAAGLYGFGTEAAVKEAPLQGSWIENGLIDAGGSHEPYLFVVRCGGQSLNARGIYEHAQSEEVIRQLKNQGVEVFHTHLYKGFGMVAEKPEMEDTIRTAAIVHRLGMKIDTYVQWDTMMYETRASLDAHQYFNAACFQSPQLGSAGNPSIGTYRLPYIHGPRFEADDIGLYKSFKISGPRSVQFRAQAFNVFNHPLDSFVQYDPALYLHYDAYGALPVNGNQAGYAGTRLGHRTIQLQAKLFF